MERIPTYGWNVFHHLLLIPARLLFVYPSLAQGEVSVWELAAAAAAAAAALLQVISLSTLPSQLSFTQIF